MIRTSVIETQKRLHLTANVTIDLVVLEVSGSCLRVEIGYFTKQLLNVIHHGVDPIGEIVSDPIIPRPSHRTRYLFGQSSPGFTLHPAAPGLMSRRKWMRFGVK